MKRKRISKIDQLHERALKLVEALKSAREKGTITPNHPMTGRTLAVHLNKHFGWDISADAGVRELVNHARSCKLPVAGDGRGYFFGRDSAEMGVVEQDLKSRVAKIGEALRGVQACRREMVQIEAELFKGGHMPVEMSKEQVENLVGLFNPETPIIHLSRENFDNIIFTLEKAWQDAQD